MNTVNMAAQSMANGLGGPVGGMPMLNSVAASSPPDDAENLPQNNLNTYIYDYFLKKGLYDCARILKDSPDSHLKFKEGIKSSPGRRDGEVNGVDDNAMDTDSKDDLKIPSDLPKPHVPEANGPSPFLLEWWSMFWELYSERNKKSGEHPNTPVAQFAQQSRSQRFQRSNQLMYQQAALNPQMHFQQQMLMRNMNGNDLPKRAMMQNGRTTYVHPAPMMMKGQSMMAHQMQRSDSDIDMNGQRPQSPTSVENTPSPAKRPRLDMGPFNGQQMGPNGRAQGMPNGGAPLLVQNGINPQSLNQAQLANFNSQNLAVQQKSVQVYAQNLAMHQRQAMDNQGLMQKGMQNPAMMGSQGSPMMPSMADGQIVPMPSEFYQNGPGAARLQMQQNPNGNHALQDYQMQLMLLEQQNKKRLLMARQEQQDTRPDGVPLPPGTAFAPGMSPQGSRSGPSPNPSEQMKREPKMGQPGIPGSPMPGDGGLPARSSPANMAYVPGQLAPDMQTPFFGQVKINDGMSNMMPNGSLMRPPVSHPFNGQPINTQMEAIARNQPGSRGPSGTWQQGPQGQAPMMQQPPPTQQQALGTPQQRNAMPPPQAPPAANGRQQASPQQPNAAAPPTPQQSNKPNPKTKKEGKAKRDRPNKKNSAAALNATATPSSEAEPPPTPTPSTPITPQHAQSFNPKPNAAQNSASVPPSTTAPPAATAPVPAPQQDPSQFANVGASDADQSGTFNMDFGSLDTGDVLEAFDFDSFLEPDGGNFSFDPANLGYDGVETNGGDSIVPQ